MHIARFSKAKVLPIWWSRDLHLMIVQDIGQQLDWLLQAVRTWNVSMISKYVSIHTCGAVQTSLVSFISQIWASIYIYIQSCNSDLITRVGNANWTLLFWHMFFLLYDFMCKMINQWKMKRIKTNLPKDCWYMFLNKIIVVHQVNQLIIQWDPTNDVGHSDCDLLRQIWDSSH
jgi:hypothetical protein